MNDRAENPYALNLPLTHRLTLSPIDDPEPWQDLLPAKAACYLLVDAQDQPVLLATVGNLRRSLVHRLTLPDAEEDDQPTRKADLRQVVAAVRYRPVFSRFEADLTYMEHARRIYPKTYHKLLRRFRGHWMAVCPSEAHPQWKPTSQPRHRTQQRWHQFGPIASHAAVRSGIEALQSMFDLCRYHEILVKAPHGEACAYKQMGRCPAPCDGSVSMDSYRMQIEASMAFMRDGGEQWRDMMQQQMAEASRELNFERAGQLRDMLSEAELFERRAFAACLPMEQWRWVLIQPGRRKRTRRIFLIKPDAMAFLGEMQKRDFEQQRDWLIPAIDRFFEDHASHDRVPDTHQARRLALAAWHRMRDLDADQPRSHWLFAHPQPDHDAIEQALRVIVD